MVRLDVVQEMIQDFSQQFGGRLAHQVSLIFFIDPPVRKSGEAFTCDITLVDQFAQPHTIRGLNLIHLGAGK